MPSVVIAFHAPHIDLRQQAPSCLINTCYLNSNLYVLKLYIIIYFRIRRTTKKTSRLLNHVKTNNNMYNKYILYYLFCFFNLLY